MEQRYSKILEWIPEPLRTGMTDILERRGDEIEDFRFRGGCPAGAILGDREIAIKCADMLVTVDSQLLIEIFRRVTKNSTYAVQEQLRQGFLILPGGHRMGVCGTVVRDANGIRTIRELQSLNLRISHEWIGIADPAANLLWSNPASALIIGCPGSGKTTVLRDAIRQLSDRFAQHVGVVDERGEIAAVMAGQPQFRIGRMTDVLTGCCKQEGIELLLRTMRPAWIALDEITAESDVKAIARASYCGVRFLATAHTLRAEDLYRRPVYRSLMESGVFENCIEILPDRTLRCERMEHAAC